MDYFKKYFQESRTPLYSLLITTPLLIIYESLLYRLNRSDITGIRNAADVLIRRIFHHFDIYGFYIVGVIIFVSMFLAFYFRFQRNKSVHLNLNFFVLMVVESLVYAFVLVMVMNRSSYLLSSPSQFNTHSQLVVMAIGAGIYEEFVFRFIMISAGLFFFNKLLKWEKNPSKIASIILAALLFSLFHYIGRFGEAFQIKSFLLRAIAGLLLSIIYIFRGYGITAYTHILYDLILIYIF